MSEQQGETKGGSFFRFIGRFLTMQTLQAFGVFGRLLDGHDRAGEREEALDRGGYCWRVFAFESWFFHFLFSFFFFSFEKPLLGTVGLEPTSTVVSLAYTHLKARGSAIELRSRIRRIIEDL